MSSTHSIGAMNQLADALDAAGFTPDDVTKLRQSKELTLFKQVLYGYAKIVQVTHVIDCDANPFIPDGWGVVEHRKGGQLNWDATEFLFYRSERQTYSDKSLIVGNILREELKDMPVFNANVLDYLLAHPELILEEWKGKKIFFWGTIYMSPDGDLVVRYFEWLGCKYGWSSNWLVNSFNWSDPAIMLA